MRNLILIAIVIIGISCAKKIIKAPEMSYYPKTEKKIVKDVYFGQTVEDPYRWLEDDRSVETGKWVDNQNKVTFDYLNTIPFRKAWRERQEELWNYEKISAPFKKGGKTYFYKNNGLQNQYVLWRQQNEGEPEVFLDPNLFSKDGTTSLAGISFTKDGKYAVYQISEGGSDWRKVLIMNSDTKKVVEDTLRDVKFSGLSWKGSEGFFYSSYDKPKGSELSAKTDQHKLYYHKLGTKQSEDKVIFGQDIKRRYVGGYVSEDNKTLFISAANATTGNELYMMDLESPDGKLKPIQANMDSDSDVIDKVGNTLFILTNYKAANKKVVTVSADDPRQENWKDFYTRNY